MLTNITSGIFPCGCYPRPESLSWTTGLTYGCGLPSLVSVSHVDTLPFPFGGPLAVFTGSQFLPFTMPGSTYWYVSEAYPVVGAGCDTRTSRIWAVGQSGSCGCTVTAVLATFMNDGSDWNGFGFFPKIKGLIGEAPISYIRPDYPANSCDPFTVTQGWYRGTNPCPACSLTG
ncbi:hypothetical protein [Singulisphaera sp. PoT]|uniref:hypothetical protein n=1 Tax=Singulisphaera sp. PoT TaxID=3411797 RepID=UPI003BF51687